MRTHKNSAKVDCRWAIGLIFPDGLMFVTEVDNRTKNFYWESGKEPLYFESKSTADDYAFGMLINGYPAAVMELPAALTIKNGKESEHAEQAKEGRG